MVVGTATVVGVAEEVVTVTIHVAKWVPKSKNLVNGNLTKEELKAPHMANPTPNLTKSSLLFYWFSKTSQEQTHFD